MTSTRSLQIKDLRNKGTVGYGTKNCDDVLSLRATAGTRRTSGSVRIVRVSQTLLIARLALMARHYADGS